MQAESVKARKKNHSYKLDPEKAREMQAQSVKKRHEHTTNRKWGEFMAHPNEPDMEELKALRQMLYAQESTHENVRKIEAIERQIERRKGESDGHCS